MLKMGGSDHQNETSHPNEDTNGSRYALEVAFQTLKERCQKLQKRLGVLEAENVSLRFLRRKDDEVSKTPSDSHLKEVITQLKQQNQQLTYHVEMVTSENKQLWKRLMQSSKINRSLGNQLTEISDTLNRYPGSDGNIGKSVRLQDSSACEATSSNILKRKNSPLQLNEIPGAKSLEEISLKLLRSLHQEKSELEDQCFQLLELKDLDMSPSLAADYLKFPSCWEAASSGEFDDGVPKVSLTELRQVKDSFIVLKKNLSSQGEIMQSVLQNLARIKEGGESCCMCQKQPQQVVAKQSTEAPTARFESITITDPDLSGDSADEEVRQLQQDTAHREDMVYSNGTSQASRICPMCGVTFSNAIPFDVFHEHVVSHFEPEQISLEIAKVIL